MKNEWNTERLGKVELDRSQTHQGGAGGVSDVLVEAVLHVQDGEKD